MIDMTRILEYIRLFRFHTSAVTAMVPFIGSIVMGQRNGLNLIIIFFIGILYHIYGFVLNEYIDVEVDKKNCEN